MEKLQLWSKCISIVTIFSGVMLAVMPKEKLTSSFKYLVAIILLLMSADPMLAFFESDSDISAFSFEGISEEDAVIISHSQLINCAEAVLENKICACLEKNNINVVYEVEIIEKDGVANLKVYITASDNEADKKIIKEKIAEIVPADTIIEFTG